MALEYNVDNMRRDLVPAGTWGNQQVQIAKAVAIPVGLAAGEQLALLKVPAGCTIYAFSLLTSGTVGGTGTTLTFKLVETDGTDYTGGELVASQVATTALDSNTGNGFYIDVTTDCYVVAQGGVDTTTTAATVNCTLEYLYTST